jgi:RHS repeat-associated protein
VSMYGSGRLGVWNVNRNVVGIATIDYSAYSSNFTRGHKLFELANHLGNVLVVISDKKLAVDSDNDGLVNYYNAEVVLANDEYPFGMQMPGRKYKLGDAKYRYGYNGQEYDKDYCDCENVFTAEFWEYDSRIGRRFNIDPVEDIGLSPYVVNRNNPIIYKDPNGDCPFCFGFILGALAEIAEQTVGIAIENMANGKKWNDGLIDKIDWVDVATSGLQGGLMTLPGVGIGAEVISEVMGNYVKSAFDYTNSEGGKNVFDGSKTMGDFEKDFVVNSAGSIAGIKPVSKVTTTVTKVTAKTVIKKAVKETVKAVAGGVKTGAAETTTKSLVDPSKFKPDKKSNSNEKPKPKTTSEKSKKESPVQTLRRSLNGKSVPVNNTQPYDNEWFDKVPAKKK